MSLATDAAAVIAAIDAQFTTKRAYELGDPALASLTTDYIVVLVFRRYVPGRRASGEVTLPGGRVVTRYVAKRAGNLRVLRERTTTALEDRILAGDVGPFVFENSGTVDQDGDWLVDSDNWTY